MNTPRSTALVVALVLGLIAGGGATYSWMSKIAAPLSSGHTLGQSGNDIDGSAVDSRANKKLVRVTQAQIAELGIKTDIAKPGSLRHHLSLLGEVVLDPDHVARVVPRAPGIALRIDKRVGDTAQVGETLAVLDSAELATTKAEYLAKLKAMEVAKIDLGRTQTIHDNTKEMLEFMKTSPSLVGLQTLERLDMGANRSALITAYAEMITKRAEYKREEQLLAKKIASDADYQATENVYRKAQAVYLSIRDEMTFNNQRALEERKLAFKVAQFELKSAERHLHKHGLLHADVQELATQEEGQLSHSEIRAPISGIITARDIVLGEMITESDEAFQIADLSDVWVNLVVYQKNLAMVRAGQTVTISFGNGIPDANGTIDYVGVVVSEETRSAIARVVLDNPEGYYRPGLFVTAKIQVDEQRVSVLLPKEALQRVDEESKVFVQTDDGFELRSVVVGRFDDVSVEITAGLMPGERIVTANALTLKSELAKSEFETD